MNLYSYLKKPIQRAETQPVNTSPALLVKTRRTPQIPAYGRFAKLLGMK